MSLVEKVAVTIKSLLLTVFYIFKLLFSNERLLKGKRGLIVSLTSYGPRVKFAFLTIESIFNQALKPDAIVLWLYKDDKPKGIWLKILERQVKRGLIVKYIDVDVRSFKKLSFVLDDKFFSRADFIVTADDDVFYPYRWLQGFNEYYSGNNKPAVLCYRARNIKLDVSGGKFSYKYWELANKENISKYGILPTGVSGICYPREALDKSISLFDVISEICPYADDIWYKMVTTKNKFPSKLIVDNSVHFTPVFTGFTKGLERFNVLNELNDKQFIASMEYFKLNADNFLLCRDDT